MTKRLKAASQQEDWILCSVSRTEPLLRPGTHYEKERPGSNEEAPFKLTAGSMIPSGLPQRATCHRCRKCAQGAETTQTFTWDLACEKASSPETGSIIEGPCY